MSLVPFASFALQPLLNALGVPSPRLSIDITTFISYVLPPLVCFFVVAMLAVTPGTRTVRVALWPVVALLALRAALSVDWSFGKIERKSNNTNFVLFMVSIAARTLDWTLAKGPLVRHLRPKNSSPSIIMDAFDLAANFRGIGWEWSRYQSYTPRETRPANRIAFVFYTFLSAVAHALICGAAHRAILALVSMDPGSALTGPSIFDDTLPFPARYLRAGVISALMSVMVYAVMHMGYDCCTIPAVLVLGQDPVQWPPAFDAPWRATSLSDFWGRRWHQFFRHVFLLGGRLLSVALGPIGIPIGAFLASALWHHISLLTLDSRADTYRMFLGFGMMGPGVLAERVFYRVTGRRVGGLAGWAWTMAWLLVWGNPIVEGFARAGFFGCSSPLDSASPLRGSVERLMAGFDAWLRTL